MTRIGPPQVTSTVPSARPRADSDGRGALAKRNLDALLAVGPSASAA